MRRGVSVVLPVYNAEKYVADAISSILAQSYPHFELLIMDDGSNDASANIIGEFKDPRIRFFHQSNAGLSRSLNRLIALAKYDLIARMDADDISHPLRLQEQVDFMTAHPECVVVGTNANFVAEDGVFLYTSKCRTEWGDIKAVLPASPHFHSSTVFRKWAFDRAGGYFEQIPQFFEDQILWNMMAKWGELRNLEAVLLDYRITPTSISADKSVEPALKKIAIEFLNSGGLTESQRTLIASLKARQQQARGDRWAWYWSRLGKIYLEHNFDRARAVRCLIKSLVINPRDSTVWFNLALAFTPRHLIHRWKSARGVYARVW